MADYRLHREPLQASMGKELFKWIGKYWFQMTLACFVLHLYNSREVQTSVQVFDNKSVSDNGHAQKVSATLVDELSVLPVALREDKNAKRWKASDFKNLSFVLDPNMAEIKSVDKEIVNEKVKNCRKYVERFAATAISEMKQFGIPASITLAQGLIETDAGGSLLASESNNHFGIKCRSKCRHCTCRNYSDDDVYDMFRVFDTSWESFREHSKLLQIDRYKNLKKLGSTDYEGWARGLKKAGYATDKNYDKKLIQIIEVLDLHQFDE